MSEIIEIHRKNNTTTRQKIARRPQFFVLRGRPDNFDANRSEPFANDTIRTESRRRSYPCNALNDIEKHQGAKIRD